MKKNKDVYLSILLSLLIIAGIVLIGVRTTEDAIVIESSSNQIVSRADSIKLIGCDELADTFYLDFHSNMDSVAFYKERESNSNTRNGIDIGQGIKLHIAPKFNKKGCLDYVILSHSLLESVGKEASKILLKELQKIYGRPVIMQAENDRIFRYKGGKVTLIINKTQVKIQENYGLDLLNGTAHLKKPKDYYNEREVYESTLFFYSKRYIQKLQVAAQQELELKKQRDSLDRTVGNRLK